MNTPRFYVPVWPMPRLPRVSWVESYQPPARGAAATLRLQYDGIAHEDVIARAEDHADEREAA